MISRWSRVTRLRMGKLFVAVIVVTSFLYVYNGGCSNACARDVSSKREKKDGYLAIIRSLGSTHNRPSVAANTGTTLFGGFYPVGDEDRYLHSAFLDTRFQSNFIRIFGMQSKTVTSELRCRIHINEESNIDLPSEKIFPVYEEWPSPKLQYHAYYYGCVVPDDFKFDHNFSFSVYASGSLSETFLPLHHVHTPTLPRSVRGGVAVCIKAMWGNLNISRLVEWIEFHRQLGVEKIVMYDTTVTGPAVRVLLHYKQLGVVDILPFTYTLNMATLLNDDPFKSHLSSDELLLEQTFLVSMNDCFYRYSHLYQYVMVVDLDEIIVPTVFSESLFAMVSRAEEQYPNTSGFLFATAWHFEQFSPPEDVKAPSYLHMQRYLKRTPVMQSQPKSIINTDGAVSINWHGVVTMPTGRWQGNKYLPWQRYGYVHHYRKQCRSESSKCSVMLKMEELDEVVPKYINELQPKVAKVLEDLRLLPVL